MARMSRRAQTAALYALAAPLAYAQLSDLPDLSTATQTTATTDDATTATTTDATSATTDDTATTTPASTDAQTTQTTTTATFGSASTTVYGQLSDAPTIAGAGIPTLVIPYTADAPFMQKSNLPEGTVFIAVGAVLAFLGMCVLLWRGLTAWSVNRSVKKAAIASMRGAGSEKTSTWGGSTGYNPARRSASYKDVNGSSMSLDALTSNGKHLSSRPHFKDHAYHEIKRESTPPAGLFFSPTAQAGREVSANRNSAYLPAGYYASPSAQAAGGAMSTTIGGNLVPYARHSTHNPSPPASPGLPPTSRSSATYRASSRDGLRASRDGYGPSGSAGNISARNSDFGGVSSAAALGGIGSRASFMDGTPRQGHSSGLYAQPSSSSLMVGLGGTAGHGGDSGLPGSRAPSAYFEDLLEEHGNGPRERF